MCGVPVAGAKHSNMVLGCVSLSSCILIISSLALLLNLVLLIAENAPCF